MLSRYMLLGKGKNINLVFIGHFLTIFFPLLFSEDSFRYHVYQNYLLQLFWIFVYVCNSKEQSKFMLSPSVLSSLYLLISFILADLLFRNDLYLLKQQYLYYLSWNHIRIAACYYNACFFILIMTYKLSIPVFIKNGLNRKKAVKPLFFNDFISLFLLFVFLYYNIQIDLPGGNIDLPIIAATLLAIIIFIRISEIHSLYRFILYIGVIAIFAIFRFDNKREAIFLFFPIVLLELSKIKSNIFKITNILKMFLVIIGAFSLIIFMSIKRADNSQNTNSITSLTDILPQFIKYLSAETVLPIIADNLEVNYVYINSHQAIEFIENKPTLKTYGSTYIKPLFLFVSRELYPEKPEAVITLYTREFDAAAAATGYCLPLSLQTEAYWNFGVLGGLVSIFIIFLILNCCYKYILISLEQRDTIANVFYLYVYYVFFILYRDSGFEKVILWLPVAYFFLKSIKIIYNKK